MNLLKIILIVIACAVILYILSGFVASAILYNILLVRTSKKKWSRDVNLNWDDEYKTMYKLGFEWADENLKYKKDVDIVSDGFHLYGEYFDFGFDKTVIVIAGRMECCKYAYFFAKPYKEAGYNLLAIDNRCHGMSEGKYHSLGYLEHRDLINWVKMLEEDFGVKQVVIHGICIGANVGMFALTSPDRPQSIKAIVTEGMFATFGESLKLHLKEFKQPNFPTYYITSWYIKMFSKADIMHDGPIFRIDKVPEDVKILMLYSKEDKFSPKRDVERLYEKAGNRARLVWFDKGNHSRVRINAIEKYDKEIKEFLSTL